MTPKQRREAEFLFKEANRLLKELKKNQKKIERQVSQMAAMFGVHVQEVPSGKK
jgi:hypothetical protein